MAASLSGRRREPTMLTNKVALITGGARGIGAAIAHVMAVRELA
jgi:NAD(P)-dependent dehydrogenase (short-subunit alcohol dehydrogenase family)